jgi:L-ascorbate metabolism protein UlaG (beta-lactamase superfamily)
MTIEYLGHSSFKITFKSGSVVTDPFDKADVGLKFPKTVADIVTVSHNHSDHNKTENVSDFKKILEGPGEYDINGISITAIASYHDDNKGEERGKNTIFVFEAEDLRIAHLGDLGHTLSEKQMSAIGEVDVLMIPVGGVYTIDDTKAAEVARGLEPNFIIPMHFKKEGMSETFNGLTTEEPFVNEMALPVEKTKKLTVKASELRKADESLEEQRIVLFEN